jgi:hypothetical protein
MKEKLLESIGILRKRQAMIIGEHGYIPLVSYLLGYYDSISHAKGVDYLDKFQKWLMKKQKTESSLHWSEYIYRIMADEYEEKARQLLFDLFEEFLNQEKE